MNAMQTAVALIDSLAVALAFAGTVALIVPNLDKIMAALRGL